MDDDHGQTGKSEIAVVLETLWESKVEPPQYIKDMIDELTQVQFIHDLICIELDSLRAEATKKVMEFFLEWKMNQE